jgi:hypothetical protein
VLEAELSVRVFVILYEDGNAGAAAEARFLTRLGLTPESSMTPAACAPQGRRRAGRGHGEGDRVQPHWVATDVRCVTAAACATARWFRCLFDRSVSRPDRTAS